MNATEFYNQLKNSDLEVTFTKVTDGSKRVLKCTSHVPEEYQNQVESAMSNTNTGLITVFDTENKGFRSFWLDSVISINPLDTTFGLLQE